MSRKTTRRAFLAATGSTALLGATTTATAASSTSIDGAPYLSEGPYPLMGTEIENPKATVFGNFKCPYTQEFVRERLASVVEEFVVPGRLNLEFQALAYEPDPSEPSHGSSEWYISSSDPYISRCAQGVWEIEPENYWRFLRDMFDDLISGNVTNSDMRARLEPAGVRNWGLIPNEASQGEWGEYVRWTTDVADRNDVDWTPTIELNGDTTSPHYGDLSAWLEARI